MLNKRRIQRFKHLWTTELQQHILLEIVDDNDQFTGYYMIYNVETTGMHLFEDSELYDYIIKQMKDAGVKILDIEAQKARIKSRVE